MPRIARTNATERVIGWMPCALGSPIATRAGGVDRNDGKSACRHCGTTVRRFGTSVRIKPRLTRQSRATLKRWSIGGWNLRTVAMGALSRDNVVLTGWTTAAAHLESNAGTVSAAFLSLATARTPEIAATGSARARSGRALSSAAAVIPATSARLMPTAATRTTSVMKTAAAAGPTPRAALIPTAVMGSLARLTNWSAAAALVSSARLGWIAAATAPAIRGRGNLLKRSSVAPEAASRARSMTIAVPTSSSTASKRATTATFSKLSTER